MGELKITDLVDKGQIEELQKLETKLSELRDTYVDVVKELSKGIKMNIETPKDLDKLYEIYNAQASRANKVTHDMNETLGMQKKVLQDVASEIQKKDCLLPRNQRQHLPEVCCRNSRYDYEPREN